MRKFGLRGSVAVAAAAALVALAISAPTASEASVLPTTAGDGSSTDVVYDSPVSVGQLEPAVQAATADTEIVFEETLPGDLTLTTGVIVPPGGDVEALTAAALAQSHDGVVGAPPVPTLSSKSVIRIGTADSVLASLAGSVAPSSAFTGTKPAGPPTTTQPIEPLAQPMSGDLAVCGASWAPGSPTFKYTYLDDTKQRRMDMNLKWGTVALANLKKCDFATYEHEFWEYNYSGNHFFGYDMSWSTTLPRGYHDTPASDSSNEISHTIGTWDVSKLQAGTTYKVTVVTSRGNATSGKAKISGQRGHRVPPSCHSTWCIFGLSTAKLIPAWGVTFPSSGGV